MQIVLNIHKQAELTKKNNGLDSSIVYRRQ